MVKDELHKMTKLNACTGVMKFAVTALGVVGPFVYYIYTNHGDPAILAFGIAIVLALFLLIGVSSVKFMKTLPQLKEEPTAPEAENKNAKQSAVQSPVETSSQASIPLSFTAKATAGPMPEVIVSLFAGSQADGITKTSSVPANVSTASAQQARSGSTSSATAEASAKSQAESKTSATADTPFDAESSAAKTQAEESATATNDAPADDPTSADEPVDG